MLTQARLKELFTYDPLIGTFVRRERRGSARAGEIAGTDNGCGYLQIAVDRRVYVAHRMAWLYVHGIWPPAQIDHINMIRDDNRIANLRKAGLPYIQLGASVRYDFDEVMKYLKTNRRLSSHIERRKRHGSPEPR